MMTDIAAQADKNVIRKVSDDPLDNSLIAMIVPIAIIPMLIVKKISASMPVIVMAVGDFEVGAPHPEQN